MIQHRLPKVSYRFLMVGPVVGMVLGLANHGGDKWRLRVLGNRAKGFS